MERRWTVEGLVKYPRTRHLVDLGASTRDDLVMAADEAEAFLRAAPHSGYEVKAEEKIDGANIGVSVSDHGDLRARNRSHFVNSKSHPQFSQLNYWLQTHRDSLSALLGPPPSTRILFGERVAARHTLHYAALPDLFIAFDLYDVETHAFLSRRAFDAALDAHAPLLARAPGLPLPPAPTTAPCALAPDDIVELMSALHSAFAPDTPIEGLVLRVDRADTMLERAKVVRAAFRASHGVHWTKHTFVKNRLAT